MYITLKNTLTSRKWKLTASDVDDEHEQRFRDSNDRTDKHPFLG